MKRRYFFNWSSLWLLLCFTVAVYSVKIALHPNRAPNVNNNPCLNPENLCFNGGTCVLSKHENVTTANTVCSCPVGYTGVKCENLVKTLCLKNLCANGGTCFIGEKTAECVCPPGVTGRLCEVFSTGNCPAVPCPLDSVCQNDQCECPVGWLGNPGSCVSDPCFSNPCSNGATCLFDSAKTSYFTCSCPPGFTGSFCQIRPVLDSKDGPCKKVQCPAGQRCISRGEIVSCIPATVDGVTTVARQSHLVPTKLNLLPSNNVNVSFSQSVDYRDTTTAKFPLVQSHLLCPPQTCLNGGVCRNDGATIYCTCRPGFTGARCESDEDECTVLNPCQHGVCQNQHGSYQCFCRPGYVGVNCTDDFDECSSNPCLNQATCVNTIGGYDCLCTSNYTGPNCDALSLQQRPRLLFRPTQSFTSTIATDVTNLHTISSCVNHACLNGGTCVDGLVGYQCICPQGFFGLRCDVKTTSVASPGNNICLSNPCTAGGRCVQSDIDPLGYTCTMCSGKSLEDPHCDNPEDQCARILCLNNGTCQSNSGECACPIGYSGVTCENKDSSTLSCRSPGYCQNGGRCKSERTVDAECICANGFGGKRCENLLLTKRVSSSVCISNNLQCANGGTCIEAANSEACLCRPGFTGGTCESEIDFCANFPCSENSTEKCASVGGRFKCVCKTGYAGATCNDTLAACQQAAVACPSGQTCHPSSSDGRGYYCSCAEGYGGDSCQELTTVSFSSNSLMAYVSVTGSPANYSLNFQFRTTLADAVVVSGDSILSNNFVVFLKDGRLRCLWLAKELVLKIRVNDGLWYGVQLRMNGTHVLFTVSLKNVDLAVEILSLTESVRPVFTTKFGGGGSSGLKIPSKTYAGCLQSISIDGKALYPKMLEQSSTVNVTPGCPRREQCAKQSCNNNGRCVDLWSKFECQCDRPYLPPYCSHSLPAATFGYGTNRSFVEIVANSTEKELLYQNVDVSMLIRTRQTDGALLYIGHEASDAAAIDSFFALQLENSRLKCTLKLGQPNPLNFTGDPKINDGQVHLIRVKRSGFNVEGFVDDKKIFKYQIQGRYVYPLFSDFFLLGGYPEHRVIQSKRFAESPDILISPAAFTTAKTFKGTIQDPRINDALILMYPPTPDVSLDEIPVFGASQLRNNVLQGTVSDDVCKSQPCKNGGVCSVTFNDFACTCPHGWRGKTCARPDYCHQNPCPAEAQCRNTLPDGYVCTSDVTMSNTSYARFSLQNFNANDRVSTLGLKLRTRDENGIILYLGSNANGTEPFFALEFVDGALNVAFSLANGQMSRTVDATSGYPLNDGLWHELRFAFGERENTLLEVDNSTRAFKLQGSSNSIPLSDVFQSRNAQLFVGTLPSSFSHSPIGQQRFGALHSFKGCLGDVIFGPITEDHSGFPLSFYKPKPQQNSTIQYFALTESGSLEYKCHGDPVCDRRCQNGATCIDLFNEFRCDCALGFEGDICETNIDDCKGHKCLNNASCVDGIANYTCACSPGTTGRYCEIDIDECSSSPCLNKGTCNDLRNGYQCLCHEDYTGKNCDFSLLVDCQSNPCLHNGKCSDVLLGPKKSFNCSCHSSYFGQFCENEVNFCERTPCRSNGTCTSHPDTQDVSCNCVLGFEGKLCETNINDCQNSPCVHGTCVDGVANFTCSCMPGWTGFVCDQDINECLSSPCSSRATCINNPGNFTCLCPEYYLGDTCDVEGSCLKSPCQRGHCQQVTATGHTCQCPVGYTGQLCETEINYCDSTPCLNKANCSRMVGGYTCHCLAGFSGVNCETNIDECASSPCHNNGACMDDINKFACTCNGTGYSGDVCQHDIDECTLDGYCTNGVCRNLIGSYNCSCNQGFVGQKCNFKDPCVQSNVTFKCQNGGKCHKPKVLEVENRVDYECLCSSSFSGDLCETPKQSLSSDGPRIAYIVAPIVGFVLLVCLISCIVFLVIARNKRATRGTYSPSRQEKTGAPVPMGAMMKPPPEERLI